jgi:2-polyprenyl-3-methyl-5-hydroxy-6-metoxy-1,4-benzoquinol methylase
MRVTRHPFRSDSTARIASSEHNRASAVIKRKSQNGESHHYIIRGGIEGRERLRVLARVMRPTTLNLFDRVEIKSGMACLDVGCGGGDVTFELADLVGPKGRVVGWDIDETKLELARREAEERQQGNVEFRLLDISESDGVPEFDVVYARFLLTHLVDPAGALAKMLRVVQPNGLVILEDIDFTGYFCHPYSAAFWRYIELYTQTARRRGGDPNIGQRLPGMLVEAGIERVKINVVQRAALDGEVKIINPLTMENIVDSVLAEGLASRAELDILIDELYEFSRNPRTIASIPRIVQAWGHLAN